MTALALLVVVAGAAIQSLTGFGFALASAPGLVLVLGAHDAVPVVLLLGVVVNLLCLAHPDDRAAVSRREAMALVAFSVPGLALGAAVFARLGDRALALCVCAGVLAAVAARVRARPTASPRRPSPAARPLAGLAAGALTTTTGANGPPLVAYLLATGAPPARVRSTLAVVFAVLSLVGLATLTAGAGVHLRPLDALLACGVLAGHGVGRTAARRFDGTPVLEWAILATLTAAAVSAGAASLG